MIASEWPLSPEQGGLLVAQRLRAEYDGEFLAARAQLTDAQLWADIQSLGWEYAGPRLAGLERGSDAILWHMRSGKRRVCLATLAKRLDPMLTKKKKKAVPKTLMDSFGLPQLATALHDEGYLVPGQDGYPLAHLGSAREWLALLLDRGVQWREDKDGVSAFFVPTQHDVAARAGAAHLPGLVEGGRLVANHEEVAAALGLVHTVVVKAWEDLAARVREQYVWPGVDTDAQALHALYRLHVVTHYKRRAYLPAMLRQTAEHAPVPARSVKRSDLLKVFLNGHGFSAPLKGAVPGVARALKLAEKTH